LRTSGVLKAAISAFFLVSKKRPSADMSVSMAARSMASVLPELMNEAIERRIIRRLRSFVGCDRAHQVGSIGRATEDGPEGLLIFPNRREATAASMPGWPISSGLTIGSVACS
jgi:hypothetical protein